VRVAYVGNFGPPYSTENDYREAFESLGHEVIALQENEAGEDAIRREALVSDLLLHTTTWDCLDHQWAAALRDELSDKGVPSAGVHLDVFHGPGRGGRDWWNEPMFRWQHLFTADGNPANEWPECTTHHWLRPAVAASRARPGTPRGEYVCDVAFVGSGGVGYHEDVWPYRRELVEWLRSFCDRRGYTFRNPGGERDQPDDGKIQRGPELADFYASAAVTVGDSLCLDRERSLYWSDRAYEAPGRAGYLIMPRIDALWEDYHGELPMYSWGDFAELEWHIDRAIANPGHRAEVRRACYDVVVDGHTYAHRARTIAETIS
jgi:hypothetical protein